LRLPAVSGSFATNLQIVESEPPSFCLPDFTSEEFIIHKVILENGAILMQQMTNLSQLPTGGKRFQFFAPFIKIQGAEGSPARYFAVID
jgi:kynurenine formamidase